MVFFGFDSSLFTEYLCDALRENQTVGLYSREVHGMHHQLIWYAVQDPQDYAAGVGVCPYVRNDRHGAYDEVSDHVDFCSHAASDPLKRNGLCG